MVEKNAMYLLQIIELQDFKKEKCSDVKKITETGRFGGMVACVSFYWSSS
jgi:hypothetical protein